MSNESPKKPKKPRKRATVSRPVGCKSGQKYDQLTDAQKNLEGLKVGEWTVNRLARVTEAGYDRWYCTCSCGAAREVSGNNLRNGITSGCGHWRKNYDPNKTWSAETWAKSRKDKIKRTEN